MDATVYHHVGSQLAQDIKTKDDIEYEGDYYLVPKVQVKFYKVKVFVTKIIVDPPILKLSKTMVKPSEAMPIIHKFEQYPLDKNGEFIFGQQDIKIDYEEIKEYFADYNGSNGDDTSTFVKQRRMRNPIPKRMTKNKYL